MEVAEEGQKEGDKESSKTTPEKADKCTKNSEDVANVNPEAMDLLNSAKHDQNGGVQGDNSDPFKVPSTIVNKEEKPQELIKEAPKKDTAPELPYKEPWWSGTAPKTDKYNMEMVKNGCIISNVDLTDKAFYVFGRLPLCDVVLEHPSISRYHAVVQYRPDGDQKGFYLYDLGSTHGTLVNKAQIRARTFYRLKVGYVVKFGGSSRLFVLQVRMCEDLDKAFQYFEQVVSTSMISAYNKVDDVLLLDL